MSHTAIASLGWAATAVFVASYFSRQPSLLRGVQMLGALLWVIYGILIHAAPVIVANVMVFSAAAWTVWRARATACAPVDASGVLGGSRRSRFAATDSST
jgi:hypothetical protein